MVYPITVSIEANLHGLHLSRNRLEARTDHSNWSIIPAATPGHGNLIACRLHTVIRCCTAQSCRGILHVADDDISA